MVSKVTAQALAPQIQAAWHIEKLLRDDQRGFCFIGGMALFRWSEPRLTRDVDLTVLCPFGEEADTIDWLLARVDKRLDNAREFALENRVLLLRHGIIDVDVSLVDFFFVDVGVARACRHLYAPGVDLTTCSAEDLIVFKAFAARGWETWDAVDETTRRTFPRSSNALRIVQYESCRGLEGWSTVLDGLDEFWDLRKSAALAAGNEATGLDEGEVVAWRWCMIPITRPIDTLIITLRNKESRVAQVLQTLARSLPDMIEFTT